MSFFKRKPSRQGEQRLETQLHVGRHSPDATIDISGCDQYRLPDDIYVLARVLRKQVLLIHSNRLTSLKTDKSYDHLAKLNDILRILDAHDNHIDEFPVQLCSIRTLQVLNLESNAITRIPKEIRFLTALQTLNVKNNQLVELPTSICELVSLRLLDISHNRISQLPQQFPLLRSLETVVVDTQLMTFPPAYICEKGTTEMLQWLCAESGIVYQPPSHSILPLLSDVSSNGHHHLVNSISSNLLDQTLNYERARQMKSIEQANISRQLLEEESRRAALIAESMANRTDLLDRLAMDQNEQDSRISDVNQRRDHDRRKLFDAMTQMEIHAKSLIDRILDTNRQMQRQEQIEQDEQQRLFEAEMLNVRREQYEDLRRTEVQRNIVDLMAQNYTYDELVKMRMKNKDQFAADVMQSEYRKSSDTNEVLLGIKDDQMRRLLQQLLVDEKFQRQAVLTLMQHKDMRTARLSQQIAMIERELINMSIVDNKQRMLRIDNEMDRLADEREQLMKLLLQLIEQKKHRTDELQKRLLEMEASRENGLIDYWCIQYQKLLDSKPSTLIMRENNLESGVMKILCRSGAEQYIPTFARHCVVTKNLAYLTEDDLQKMGIYQVGLRHTILQQIAIYCEQEGKATTSSATDEKCEEADESTSDTQQQQPMVLARYELECVVCLNEKASILFVPCGHCCCCTQCSATLLKDESCPLCRHKIQQRICIDNV